MTRLTTTANDNRTEQISGHAASNVSMELKYNGGSL